MNDWIEKLFSFPELTRMGHGQRREDLNLGLGWLYYALGRILRPRVAVVIGSYRGFTPFVFGKALMDNAGGGRVVFIDPSMVDDFWKDAAVVRWYFASMGVTNVEHHLVTTQGFVETDAYRELGDVGVLFVDGMHTAEQARFDHEAFAGKMAPGSVVCFHDSLKVEETDIYGEGRAYTYTVKHYVDELRRDPAYQVFDFPFFGDVTLVRKA